MKYITYPPNYKKEYTDANIVKAISELTAKSPDFFNIFLEKDSPASISGERNSLIFY